MFDSFSELASVESEEEVLNHLVLIKATLDGEEYVTKTLPRPY